MVRDSWSAGERERESCWSTWCRAFLLPLHLTKYRQVGTPFVATLNAQRIDRRFIYPIFRYLVLYLYIFIQIWIYIYIIYIYIYIYIYKAWVLENSRHIDLPFWGSHVWVASASVECAGFWRSDASLNCVEGSISAPTMMDLPHIHMVW